MPIHDWSRIPSGLFHDFHQTWTIQIKQASRTMGASLYNSWTTTPGRLRRAHFFRTRINVESAA